MKTITKITLTLLLGAAVAVSCKKEEPVYTITADRNAVADVPANSPGAEVIVVTTDAPYWILQTPDWVKADPVTGVGGGNSTIVTLTVSSNFKNESTPTNPRSGVLKFSGGKTSLSIPINQLGHSAAIDPSLSIGGIPSMDEFRDFIAAVNEGNGLVRWMNNSWEVELLTDLDLTDFGEWTPIGNVEASGNANNLSKATGNTFSGIFNGGGHTIRGFKATKELNTAKQTWGLFGYIDHATIKNLNVEADITLSATAEADAGIVAGTVYCSTIENVKVNAKITSSGSSASSRFAIGGIAGFIYSVYDSSESVAYDSYIKDCEVTADVTIDCGANTANNANCVMYGGIVAFSTNVKDNSRNHIENCTNNGTMTMKIGRCSGICPTANYGTYLEHCTNNASQVNTIVGGRIGQICCNLSVQSHLIDCVNNGDLTTTDSGTTTGALVALIGDDTAFIEGGERVANTGTIIGCNTTPVTGGSIGYLGLLCANTNKFDHVSDVILSGKLGKYKSDGNHEMYDVNAGNIMEFIGRLNPTYAEKVTNITYIKDAGPGPDDPDTPDSPDKNGGIDGLDLIDDIWN